LDLARAPALRRRDRAGDESALAEERPGAGVDARAGAEDVDALVGEIEVPHGRERRDRPGDVELDAARRLPRRDGVGRRAHRHARGDEEPVHRMEVAAEVEAVVDLAELTELLVTAGEHERRRERPAPLNEGPA